MSPPLDLPAAVVTDMRPSSTALPSSGTPFFTTFTPRSTIEPDMPASLPSLSRVFSPVCCGKFTTTDLGFRFCLFFASFCSRSISSSALPIAIAFWLCRPPQPLHRLRRGICQKHLWTFGHQCFSYQVQFRRALFAFPSPFFRTLLMIGLPP